MMNPNNDPPRDGSRDEESKLKINSTEAEGHPPVTPEGAIDQLEQQARIGRTRMSAKLTPAERDDIVARVKSFCSHHKGMTYAQLAKMSSYGDSVISQVLGGTYKGNTDLVLIALESVIEQESARRRDATSAPFVETRVARDIFTIAHTAVKSCRICVIYGRPRIGKTLTLQAVAAKYAGCVLVEVNERSASPTHLYRHLVKLVSRRYRGGALGSKADCFGEIVDQLAGSKRLLIFDEAENLPMASLNGIRQIHDATGCPVLFCGRPPLWQQLQATVHDKRIGGALLGRIFAHRQIDRRARTPDGKDAEPLFTVREILQMIARWEVRIASDAAKWLCGLANLIVLDDGREGRGLGYALSLFELTVQCKRKADLITLEHLRQVNNELMDEDYAAQVEIEIDSWLERFAKLA